MCSSFPLGHNFPYCKFWAFFLATLTPSRAPLQRCRGFVQSLHPGRRERLWLKCERGHPWSAGCWAVDARRQIRGEFTLFLGANERGMHDACSGPRQAHKAGNRRRGLGANEGVGAKDNGYLQSSRVPPVPTRSTNPVSHLLLDGTFCSSVFCWLLWLAAEAGFPFPHPALFPYFLPYPTQTPLPPALHAGRPPGGYQPNRFLLARSPTHARRRAGQGLPSFAATARFSG